MIGHFEVGAWADAGFDLNEPTTSFEVANPTHLGGTFDVHPCPGVEP